MSDPDLVQPLENALADLRVAHPFIARPPREHLVASGTRSARGLSPEATAAMLGVGVERSSQGRSAQVDGIEGSGELEVGNRCDELVPMQNRCLLDLVEVGLG